MDFRWPDWTALSVFMYLVILAITVAVTRSSVKYSWPWEYEYVEGSRRARKKFAPHMWRAISLRSMLGFVVICAALNGMVYVGGAAGSSTPYASSAELAQEFGLTLQTEYPLLLASRLGGSEASARAERGFFTARAAVSIGPASALSVGFTQGDRSWVLELPVSQVTFIQSTSDPPSLMLYLENGYTGISAEETYNDCDMVVNGLFTVCLRSVATRNILVSEVVERQGLPPIITTYLDSATITLTPEMYNRVLGLDSG